MAALNTCFVAIFEMKKSDENKDDDASNIPSPSFKPSRLHVAIESAFKNRKNMSPRLVAFAKDIDGFNASVRKCTIQAGLTYYVLVGSLPYDSSMRDSGKDDSDDCDFFSSTRTSTYRLNFYNRQSKDSCVQVKKLSWNLDFSLRISSALLTGSFYSNFSFVPTWKKTGWFDRTSRGLHSSKSVSIQRVALRLLRLQIRCSEVREGLPPILAFRPLLCLVVRTINNPSIRCDSQTKSYALATLVELLRSRWAFVNRQVPDEENEKFNEISRMEQAGWRVCAPRFTSEIIVPLREAVALCM